MSIFLAIVAVIGAGSEERLQAAIERQRAAEIAHLSSLADRLAKQRNPARAAQIKACRARVAALQAKRVDPTPIMDPFSMSVGDIGVPGEMETGVFPEDARKMENMERPILEVAEYRVVQVIDGSSVLLSIEDPKFRRSNVLVILEGIDTTDVADDEKLAMNAIYEVTGTRSYTTILGATKKVLVLRQFRK